MNTVGGIDYFGNDIDSRLPAGYQTYRVTITNNSDILWEEIEVFYKILNLDGVVPLIAAGVFPPGTSMTFHLSPCNRLESYAWGFLFRDINGDLLSYRAPEGGGTFPPDVGSADPCHPEFVVT
jgi:hypothetical protein